MIPTSKSSRITLTIVFVAIIILSVFLATDTFTKMSYESISWIYLVPVAVALFRLFTIWRKR